MKHNFGLEYHLVDSCNLKCAGCSHYASLLEKKAYKTTEEIVNDLTLLRDKVGEHLRWLRLLGGEPLLHPDICECLKKIKSLFPKTDIFIVTNGILLANMKQEFYDICLKYRIKINVTDYGVIDTHAIISKLRKIGINICCYKTANKWRYQHIRLTEEKIDCLKKCTYKSECNNYKDGKIYLCPHIAYIDYFNKHFGKNIKLDETDYISIDEINSFDELIDRIKKSKPNFCYQYCNYYDIRHPKIGKWKKTENDINEFCLLP